MATTNENINIQVTVDTTKSEQSTVNYKAKIKELRDEMVALAVETNGLADATDEQREKYAALEQEAANLTDILGDVQQRIRTNADDYASFNAAMEGGKGIIAFGQGIAGVTNLLGMNSDAVNRGIQVMMGLQSVMSAVNTVQQIFNKDSKIMIAMEKLKVAALNQDKAATVGATVATGAFATGEGVATTASFTLAGACKAVGVAIKNIPVIGWILAAIAALISLVRIVAGLLSDGDEGLEQQERASENLAEQQKRYEEIDSKIIECKSDFEKWNYVLETANKDSKIYKDTLKALENELGVSLQNQQIDTKTLNKLEDIHLKIKEKELESEYAQNQYLADRNKLQQINNVLTAAASLEHKERAAFIQDQLGISEKQAAQYAAAIHNGLDNHRSFTDQLKLENNAASATYKQLESNIASYDSSQKQIQKDLGVLLDEQDKMIEEAGLQRIEADNKTVQSSKSTTDKLKKEEEKREREAKEHLDNITKANADAAKKVENYWKLYNDEIEKKNSETYEGRLDNLGREYAQTIDSLDKELEEYKNYYNNLTEEDKKALGDQLVSIEEFEKAQAVLREQALNRYVDGINKENEAEKKNEVEKQRRAIDAQNNIDDAVLATRLANLKEGSEEYWELQQEIEEERFEQEMEELRRQLEDKQITQEEYDAIAEQKEAEHQQRLLQIHQQTTQAKIDTVAYYLQKTNEMLQYASDFTMALQDAELEAVGDNEKKQKEIKKKYATANAVIQIAQIAVQTALGAMSAYQAMAGIPYVGPALGAVAAALVVATGAANAAKAVAARNNIMKAAKGAYITGASHSEGGVMMELEGGEAVLNKRAMAVPQYRALASAMNVSTGGVAFPGTNPNMALTAQVDRTAVQAIVAETIKGVSAIPVVVSESDISKTVRKVDAIEGRSRI